MLSNKIKLYCIPGWGFDAEIFQLFKMESFDMVGLNYFKEKNQSIENLACDLAGNVLNDSIVIGWSMGGLIAIKMAFLFPNKVNKIILLSSQPKFVSNFSCQGIDSKLANQFVQAFKITFNEQMDYFIRLVGYPSSSSSLYRILKKYFIVKGNKAILDQLPNFLYADLIKEYQFISTKILHIVNGKDAVISQNEKYLEKLQRNNIVKCVEETGHSGFLTHGNIYQDIIKGFC